jgi:hypothetical protein
MKHNIMTKPGAGKVSEHKVAQINDENTCVREVPLAFITYASGGGAKSTHGVLVGEKMAIKTGLFLKGYFPDYAMGDLRILVVFAPTGSEKDKEVKFHIDYNLYDIVANDQVDTIQGSKDFEDQILNIEAFRVQDVPVKILDSEIGKKRNINIKLTRIPAKDGDAPKADPIVLDVRLRYLAWAVPKPGTGEDIRNM